ncbi:hypothetical protein BDM02DRAFT_823264 [Thelephora ganbajun]|uniref:Uncharacterized protein n=1 Tax=Thelephora ganbajun TaxID=370292 RepID=A0ACB6Z5X8_THEGA|nr:hypothetical protein BDM02DRAFT_823264 [Thelephora ganbajun]
MRDLAPLKRYNRGQRERKAVQKQSLQPRFLSRIFDNGSFTNANSAHHGYARPENEGHRLVVYHNSRGWYDGGLESGNHGSYMILR